MASRIDLVDPGPEGDRLEAALRSAGFDVRRRGPSDVERTVADAVVLAGDTTGALDALRALRDEGRAPATPVVLVGVPVGAEHRGQGEPGFGAEAVLLRPVSADALVDTVHVVLGASPPISHLAPISNRPRAERTLQLPDTGIDPLRDVDEIAAEPRESSIPSGPGGSRAVAPISDRLREILHAADRRAFPQRPPIDIWLPGADMPAAELVPAELLERDEVSLDGLPDDDPVEALALSGPVLAEPGAEPAPSSSTSPGTPSSLSRKSRLPPPPPAAPEAEPEPVAPGTGVHEARVRPPEIATTQWPDRDAVLGDADGDGARRGSLERGGLLRLLLRVAELRLDARLVLSTGDETLELEVAGGRRVSVSGPAASRAAAALRARLPHAPRDEASALEALDAAVASGAVSWLARDRALRVGRERLLADAVAAPRLTFTLTRTVPRPSGSGTLGRPLAAAVVEAARRAIGEKAARAMLGGAVVVAPGPRLEAMAAEGAIAPELALLFERLRGAPLERVLAEAVDEPGAAGLVAALAAGGALIATSTVPPEVSVAERAQAARREIEIADRTAEEADYFAVLGVTPDCSDRDVEQAFEARAQALAALPLEELGEALLEPARRRALEALEEARRVLGRPRWRAAYARALSPAS